MSELLNGTLTLRGSSREAVEQGVSFVESVGSGAALAQFFAPMPTEFVNPGGSISGPAEWFFENWGCKDFDLREDVWWQETEPGDESNQWWAHWNLFTESGEPGPILKAISERFPELEVGFVYEVYVGGDEMFEEYEVIWENGVQTEGLE